MKNLLGSALLVIGMVGVAVSSEAAEPTGFVSDPAVREFGERLCFIMVNANATGKNIVETMEDYMLDHLGLSRSTPDYGDKLIAYYNDHKNEFICEGRIHSGTRTSEHIMKRAIALSIHNQVFDEFFFDTENIDVDVNAVEWVVPDPEASSYQANLKHAPWGAGEPETLIDYLDKALADPDASRKYVVREVQALREALIEQYNGKTAKELSY
jgi:hypothetical protein